MSNFFQVYQKSKKSRARLGLIDTKYGKIKTPAFMAAATKGTVKSLTPQQMKEIGIQVAFVNSYHLVTHPGPEIIKKAGGIHKFSGFDLPLMSDSGGFQVFSLASPKSQRNIGTKAGLDSEDRKPAVVKINSNGVIFRSIFDGELIEFTPEKSIEYQKNIGADLIMAFDECTYYPASYKYTKKSMGRTHEWLKRCIIKKKTIDDRRLKIDVDHRKWKVEKTSQPSILHPQNLSSIINTLPSKKPQALYGIIQGGIYKDLRIESAKFITSQPVDGIAIGGVSVGESKKEMRDQIKWVSDFLPEDKPVHLLGVGQIDDIIDLVKYGIDTFDCVEPTRLARMGTLYKNSHFEIRNSKFDEIDLLKGKFRNDLSPVDDLCTCYFCKNFSRAYLHHLFKQRELLAYSSATYHNLWVMERLFEKIRKLIGQNKI